ncbi:MAG TPA: hypothetical protein VHS59_13365 [Bacillota bacterium]|nr:hypothetical protein [Bacillota bacterium]
MYILLFVLGCSIFTTVLVTGNLITEPYSKNVRNRLRRVQFLDMSQGSQTYRGMPLVWRLFMPLYHLFIGRIRLSQDSKGSIQDKLEKSRLNQTPEQFFGQKLVILMGTAGCGLLVCLLSPNSTWTSVLNWLVLSLGGYFLPELFVRSRILMWREKVLREFPDFIDATRSYLGSGLSIFQTIKQVKEMTGPGLSPLLEKLSVELEVYDQITALRRFGQRAGLLEVDNFVVAIEQGISAGIPLKDIFLSQSHLMRELRKLSLKKRIRQKPIYLALVGGLLFINIFIIVGLPALLTIMSIRGIAE